MPVLAYRTTAAVAANVVTKGIFNGELHEYVQSPRAMITLYAVSKVLDTRVTINIGGRLVMADQLIPANTTAALIIKPDHQVYRGGALRGDRIQVDFRTVTALAAAGDFSVVVDIVPV
jgi:hypothetical protein